MYYLFFMIALFLLKHCYIDIIYICTELLFLRQTVYSPFNGTYWVYFVVTAVESSHTRTGQTYSNSHYFEPLVVHVAYDRDTMLLHDIS